MSARDLAQGSAAPRAPRGAPGPARAGRGGRGPRAQRPWRERLGRMRAWMHRHPLIRVFYRIAVAVAGTIVIVAGIILIPLPGPGSVVILLGIAILGTEFAWAQRIVRWVLRQWRRLVTRWRAWRAFHRR